MMCRGSLGSLWSSEQQKSPSSACVRQTTIPLASRYGLVGLNVGQFCSSISKCSRSSGDRTCSGRIAASGLAESGSWMMSSASWGVVGTLNTSSAVAIGFSARTCIIRSLTAFGMSFWMPRKCASVYSRSALDVRAAWSGSPPLPKLSMNSRAASAVGLAVGGSGGGGRGQRRVSRGGLPCGHGGGGHAQQKHQRQVLGPRDRAIGILLAEPDVVRIETKQHEQGDGRVRRLPELARDPEKLEEEAEPQRVVPPRAQVAERLGAGRCGAVNGQIWGGERRWLGAAVVGARTPGRRRRREANRRHGPDPLARRVSAPRAAAHRQRGPERRRRHRRREPAVRLCVCSSL